MSLSETLILRIQFRVQSHLGGNERISQHTKGKRTEVAKETKNRPVKFLQMV